jgi:excinuclease ABC subunit C
LLTHFGSLREVAQATVESLAAVVPRKTAEAIRQHFLETGRNAEAGPHDSPQRPRRK